MPEKYIFAILGGDTRQVTIGSLLLSRGHSVRVFGLNGFSSGISGAEICSSIQKAIEGCDAVILPLPASRDGITLNQVNTDKTTSILLESIIELTAKNKRGLILGGMLPDSFKGYAERLGVIAKDFYSLSVLQQKNALPSAEGALMLAMENTDTVIDGLNVLITGYGKTGKLTAEKLRALGAHVSVAARRDEVLCEITMSGFNAVRITNEKEMTDILQECDIVFNTVPHLIFHQRMLTQCKKTPLYIEIASSPGGIDIPAARQACMRLIFAPSLPGKYAPVSAGKYIFETISDILKEGGIEL